MKKSVICLLIVSVVMAMMIVACAFNGSTVEAENQAIELIENETEQVIEEEEKTVEIEEKPPYIALTEEERDLIIRCVYAEVRGCDCEDDFCMRAVCECIRDRWLERAYGKTIERVITSPNQFAVYKGELREKEAVERIEAAIEYIFTDGHWLFDDEKILHFCASDCCPSWADDFDFLCEVDGTKFFN